MTPEQVAAASKPVVLDLGDAFSRDPGTLRRARLLGISGWAFYISGRAGALGDVRAETAAAALGFIAPDAVADGWDAAARVVPPFEVAAASLAECCRWGAQQLGALPGTERLAALVERAVVAADASGMPLFAAWRAMPLPDLSAGARSRRRAAAAPRTLHRRLPVGGARRRDDPAGGRAGRAGGGGRRGGLRLVASVPADRAAGASTTLGGGRDQQAGRAGVHGPRPRRRRRVGRVLLHRTRARPRLSLPLAGKWAAPDEVGCQDVLP